AKRTKRSASGQRADRYGAIGQRKQSYSNSLEADHGVVAQRLTRPHRAAGLPSDRQRQQTRERPPWRKMTLARLVGQAGQQRCGGLAQPRPGDVALVDSTMAMLLKVGDPGFTKILARR